MANRTNGYRPEIDGLRALAVTLVILVHMFPQQVTNGFIGVDVFFVISGYLITGILVGQLGAGSFSLVDFYVRRANRIFPALILVLAACLAFGWLSLFAGEYQALGRSAFSGAAFAANINAFLEGGYWDIDAKLKPLLHLWSLGVEEQFYLFWPLMLWVVWSRQGWLASALVLVSAASLACNLWLIHVNQPATFYLPFSRFWELGVGGLLAVVEHRRPASPGILAGGRARTMLAAAGLGLLVAALLMPIPEQQFPGKYAILPVLGTALIIQAGSRAWSNATILSHPILVYVGLISFPLYMWHYPVLAFTRILENGAVPAGVLWAGLGLTVALSVATYHLVESPIRHNRRRRGAVALVLGGLLAGCGAAGCTVYAKAGLEGRYEGAARAGADLPVSPVASQAKLVVLGDSNAGHLSPGLGRIYGNQMEMIATPGWPYFIGTRYRPDAPIDPSWTGTPRTTEDALRRIMSDPSVDVVVVSNQYALYLWENLLGSQSNPAPGETSFMAYEAGLGRTVRLLAEHGKKVIVFESIPPRGDVGSVFTCTSAALTIPRRRPAACAHPLADIERDRSVYTQAIRRSVEGVPNVWLFDPLPYLCDERDCYVARNGKLLYGDMSHLSVAGSQLVGLALSRLVERIRHTPS